MCVLLLKQRHNEMSPRPIGRLPPVLVKSSRSLCYLPPRRFLDQKLLINSLGLQLCRDDCQGAAQRRPLTQPAASSGFAVNWNKRFFSIENFLRARTLPLSLSLSFALAGCRGNNCSAATRRNPPTFGHAAAICP